MLNFGDMMQIAVLGFFTGLGTSMGAKVVVVLLVKLRHKEEKLNE